MLKEMLALLAEALEMRDNECIGTIMQDLEALAAKA